MKNSNGDNFTENDPMSETEFGSEMSGRSAQERLQESARKISSVAMGRSGRRAGGVIRIALIPHAWPAHP